MRTLLFTFLVAIMSFSTVFGQKNAHRILVFSATKGFRHNSIPAGKVALIGLGAEIKMAVDTTEDAAVFTPANLARYKAVVFLNTTGNVLNDEQQKAFEGYIQGGGGFVGVHAATDTEYDWPWFTKLVGAQFASHPEMQDADLHVQDASHLATHMLPAKWRRFDEWYNFKNYHWDIVKVLLTIDEKSYKGGKNGDFHPMSWYHAYDGGRAFYTALGHGIESYSEPLFLAHLKGGILYAAGLKKWVGPKPPKAKP